MSVCWMVGRLVDRPVCHNFLKRQGSYTTTVCLYICYTLILQTFNFTCVKKITHRNLAIDNSYIVYNQGSPCCEAVINRVGLEVISLQPWLHAHSSTGILSCFFLGLSGHRLGHRHKADFFKTVVYL